MKAERAKHNAAWKAAAAAAQKANNQLPVAPFAPVFHGPPIAHRSPILHGALAYGAPNSHGPPISHVNHIGHRGHVQGVHIADLPEVQAAKARFIATYAATAARDKSAALHVAPNQHFAHVAPHVTPITNHGLFDDGLTWPRAEPYVHVDIPATHYIQNDLFSSPNIHHHDTPSLNHHPVDHHPAGHHPVGHRPVGHLAGHYHHDTPSLNHHHVDHHPVGHHPVGHHPVDHHPVGHHPVAHLAGACHNWKGDVVLCY